jgi:hypothetical protein
MSLDDVLRQIHGISRAIAVKLGTTVDPAPEKATPAPTPPASAAPLSSPFEAGDRVQSKAVPGSPVHYGTVLLHPASDGRMAAGMVHIALDDGGDGWVNERDLEHSAPATNIPTCARSSVSAGRATRGSSVS